MDGINIAALPPDPDRPVFEAVIRPHRSLGRRGFRVTMLACCLVALLVAIRFILIGFWPVTAFLALDVLGLFVAFRVSYRRARAFEEIVLTRIDLLCRRVSSAGRATEWHLNPLWTRLDRTSHEEFGLQRLALVSGRQRVDVARELSPDERARFADALGGALAAVKRGY